MTGLGFRELGMFRGLGFRVGPMSHKPSTLNSQASQLVLEGAGDLVSKL